MEQIPDKVIEKYFELVPPTPEFERNLGDPDEWNVGDVVRHPDGYDVLIIDGCFLDSLYKRVSNYWHWIRIDTCEVDSGYGWRSVELNELNHE